MLKLTTFHQGKLQNLDLPSIAYCAGELNLSPGYFGDLVKKETGKTPKEYVKMKVIDVAKERIFDHSKSGGEIVYEPGFNYPSILPVCLNKK